MVTFLAEPWSRICVSVNDKTNWFVVCSHLVWPLHIMNFKVMSNKVIKWYLEIVGTLIKHVVINIDVVCVSYV